MEGVSRHGRAGECLFGSWSTLYEQGAQVSAPRRRKELFPSKKEALLEALRLCRKAVIDSHVRVFPSGPIYKRCCALTEAIDDLAGELCGDRTVFHAEPHSPPS